MKSILRLSGIIFLLFALLMLLTSINVRSEHTAFIEIEAVEIYAPAPDPEPESRIESWMLDQDYLLPSSCQHGNEVEK